MTASRRRLRVVAFCLAQLHLFGAAVAPWIDGVSAERTVVEASVVAASHAAQAHMDTVAPSHDAATCAACQLISMASLLPLPEHGPRPAVDTAAEPTSRDAARPAPLERQGFLSRAPPVLPA